MNGSNSSDLNAKCNSVKYGCDSLLHFTWGRQERKSIYSTMISGASKLTLALTKGYDTTKISEAFSPTCIMHKKILNSMNIST